MKNKLAIDGGPPVRETMLAYGRQAICQTDIQGVVDVLNSDWLTTGPKVVEFENDFASEVGAKYAIAVNSGTAALHASLFAAGIKPGDEVITTPFTFVATANAVRYLGGVVNFVDIQPHTYNINPAEIEKNINKRTKAIIAVDFAGRPAEFDQIKIIAEKYQLPIITDAAHSLGATYKNKKVGSFADMTTFSFHPVKHITTGEGGMITTNDIRIAEKLRLFRNHGINLDYKQRSEAGSWLYDMKKLGFNYRLSDLQCALGISQLKKLPHWVKRRREIASIYTQAFRNLPEIKTPQADFDCYSSWHLYVIQLDLDKLEVGRKEIFAALRAENIGVNVHYIPVPWHSYYQQLGYEKGQWPIAENIYEKVLSLPIWPEMSNKDIQDCIDAIQKVVKAYSKNKIVCLTN